MGAHHYALLIEVALRLHMQLKACPLVLCQCMHPIGLMEICHFAGVEVSLSLGSTMTWQGSQHVNPLCFMGTHVKSQPEIPYFEQAFQFFNSLHRLCILLLWSHASSADFSLHPELPNTSTALLQHLDQHFSDCQQSLDPAWSEERGTDFYRGNPFEFSWILGHAFGQHIHCQRAQKDPSGICLQTPLERAWAILMPCSIWSWHAGMDYQ